MVEDPRAAPRPQEFETAPSVEAMPDAEQLQEARNNLLELRESLGFHYDSQPAPDRLLRLLDRAIELVPGEGEPSQEPYS